MKKQLLFWVLAAAVFVTSCKREESVLEKGVDYSGPIMVGFNNYEAVEGNITYSRVELTFKDSLQDSGIELKLSNTTGTAPEDIFVYLTKVDALISGYNSDNGGSLIASTSTEPGLQYDFSKPVVIKKGTRRAVVPIKVNPLRLANSGANAIGIAIQRVEGAGATVTTDSKQAKAVVEFSARNIYDGVYTVVSGKVTRYTAPGTPANDALSGNLAGNPDITLITAGPNTVSVPAATTGGFQWAAGNNSFVAGIDGLVITVNPNNTTTIMSTLNTTLANWAGSTTGVTYNRYDPGSKTFYLAFRWNPTANVREYEVVLRYKGPR